ncbi:hypothetical protein [Mannheimia haemolytica]|nr:hypothetical protein [Mannheimia haemolytica]
MNTFLNKKLLVVGGTSGVGFEDCQTGAIWTADGGAMTRRDDV